MREQRARGLHRLKNDSRGREVLGAVGPLAITAIFALYNGFLGIWYRSVWNGSIGVYYCLLTALRGMVLLTERNGGRNRRSSTDTYRKRMFLCTAVLLLLLNCALALPISFMVLNVRQVDMQMIPAIAMATYTTYKVTAASVNIKRAGKTASMPIRVLRTIGFIDALVSVLTLQNTLIIVNDGGIRSDMFLLSAISSAVVFFSIVVISVRLIFRCRNAE